MHIVSFVCYTRVSRSNLSSASLEPNQLEGRDPKHIIKEALITNNTEIGSQIQLKGKRMQNIVPVLIPDSHFSYTFIYHNCLMVIKNFPGNYL